MPNKDGTGPEGKGSRTGRGLGNCGKPQGNQDVTPSQTVLGRGQGGVGRGRGRGIGRGLGRGFGRE